ncbi:MAG: hypothetical protein ACXWZS_02880 [Gemmatirosa sp.]
MSLRHAVRLAIAAIVAAGCADSTTITDPSLDAILSLAKSESASVQKSLASARAATAKYHRVEAALADGYVVGSPCVSHPTLGTMGIHYVHPGMIADPALREAQPEVLLYEPQKNGQMKLVAIVYLTLATGARPSLYGRAFEDGPPVPTPTGTVPTFALHAWVWQNNPSGVFAGFNPSATCENAPAAPAADLAAHAHH